MWLRSPPVLWPSHIPAIANGKTRLIQPFWASALNATHMSLKHQWHLFNGGTNAGIDKSNFYPLFLNAHALLSGKIDWNGLAPLCLCPHPHPLPFPDSHRKFSLLACQPLFSSTLLEIPAKCILLSPQEDMSAAARSYRQRINAWQLISQGFFQRIFNFIFVASAEGYDIGRCRENEKRVKSGVALWLHWGIFYALLVM